MRLGVRGQLLRDSPVIAREPCLRPSQTARLGPLPAWAAARTLAEEWQQRFVSPWKLGSGTLGGSIFIIAASSEFRAVEASKDVTREGDNNPPPVQDRLHASPLCARHGTLRQNSPRTWTLRVALVQAASSQVPRTAFGASPEPVCTRLQSCYASTTTVLGPPLPLG